MPERVVAASGLRWLREIEPRSVSCEEMRERYAGTAEEVANALEVADKTKRRPFVNDEAHSEG